MALDVLVASLCQLGSRQKNRTLCVVNVKGCPAGSRFRGGWGDTEAGGLAGRQQKQEAWTLRAKGQREETESLKFRAEGQLAQGH